jgi:hypothetical protein
MLVFSLSANIDRTKGDDLDDNGQNLQENVAVTKDRCCGWFDTGFLRRFSTGLGRRLFLVGGFVGFSSKRHSVPSEEMHRFDSASYATSHTSPMLLSENVLSQTPTPEVAYTKIGLVPAKLFSKKQLLLVVNTVPGKINTSVLVYARMRVPSNLKQRDQHLVRYWHRGGRDRSKARSVTFGEEKKTKARNTYLCR